MADNQALARLKKSASQQIAKPEEFANKVREWQELAHVLSPAVSISALAPQHVIAPSIVVLNTQMDMDQRGNGQGVDVYRSSLFHKKPGECALTKVALEKIASSAGASFTTQRTDDRSIPNYWEMRARLTYTDFDGTPRVIERTAEVDLRDGSPQTNGMQASQIAQARRFGLRLCESKACNAAARAAWGISSKYTVEDLKKPFVTLRVAFKPDMSNPDQCRMVTERRLMGTAALYPGRPVQTDADVIEVDAQCVVDDELPAERGDEPSSNRGGDSGGEAARREPPKPDGPLVVDIKTQSGTTKPSKDHPKGRPYTRYFITLSTGEQMHTFDQGIAVLAEKCMVEKLPVEVATQEGKFGTDLLELRQAGQQPGLPIDEVTDEDLQSAKY